jgi:hypothetical protein
VSRSASETEGQGPIYDFPVEEVLAHHDGIDAGRVLERQERETAGATRRVAHDGARIDFAKLREIRAETL